MFTKIRRRNDWENFVRLFWRTELGGGSDASRRGAKVTGSIAGTAEEHPLKIGLLKSLKRARYAMTPLGHYGLAKANYTHFTEPYSALCRSRGASCVGRSRSFGTNFASVPQLSAIADHISATERNAAEAEIDAVKMKKLEFFESQLQARDPQVFDAVVIDVRNYGLLLSCRRFC